MRATVVDRERRALAAHRAALRGSPLPAPNDAPRGTFLHGFFLPFSLIVTTIRDRELRGPYLRVALLRGLIVVLVGVVAIARGDIIAHEKRTKTPGIVIHKTKHAPPGDDKVEPPTNVDVPGLHIHLDQEKGTASVSVLGKDVPMRHDEMPLPPHVPNIAVTDRASEPPAGTPPGPASLVRRAWNALRHSWAWLLTLLAFLSTTEGVVVFFSRRWDDWLSFHASRLAAIRPEDETPKTPKLAVDLTWLYRKLKRRLRGYVVFFAGIPMLLPFRLFPTIGDVAFTVALTLWGWYWLGVFSAAKSAHAWIDEERAISPVMIRKLNEVRPGFPFGPLRWYGRVWAWMTRSVNPATTTFERSPAAFLGLALARVVLSLPGLYLLARPIVPVAAGRLCAEIHPADRFHAGRTLEP